MDSIPTSTLFIILIILLFCSAYFSGSETGLLSINRYRMRYLSEQGHRGAKKAEQLLKRTDVLLSLVLIYNNLVNISASAIATIIGLRLYGDAGVAIATGMLTLFMLIFSEILPKTMAAMHPERIGFTTSHFLKPLLRFSLPLVYLINFFINGLLKIFGVKVEHKTQSISQEELRAIVNESSKFIPSAHQQMLLSILELGSVRVFLRRCPCRMRVRAGGAWLGQ